MKLAQRLQGIYFPKWSQTLGWRPIGVRSDQLGGRRAVPVYYQQRGMRVAYTHLGGFVLQTLNVRGRSVVTWRRAGHTCVISASGVPLRVLEQLADWPAARIGD